MKNPLARLTPKPILLAFFGSLALSACAGLWLQIPDSHTWQFGISLLTALALALFGLWIKATVIRLVRIRATATGQSMAILMVWIVVGYSIKASIETLLTHVVERAGFWNSRLNAHQRVFFTEPRLEAWQNDAISLLLWFVLPSLLLPVLIETVSGGNLKTVGRVYLRWQTWLTIAVAGFTGNWLTNKLTAWHPAETVHGELVSAILRLSVLYALLLAIALATLAVLSELLAEATAPRH